MHAPTCDRVYWIHFHLKILSDLGVEAKNINFPLILRVTKQQMEYAVLVSKLIYEHLTADGSLIQRARS